MEFINISINYDSKNAILEADKLIMGKKKAIEVIPKLIEENGEEFLKNLLSGNIKSGNLLHPYAYLYIMLNKERDVVKKYEKAINEILIYTGILRRKQ